MVRPWDGRMLLLPCLLGAVFLVYLDLTGRIPNLVLMLVGIAVAGVLATAYLGWAVGLWLAAIAWIPIYWLAPPSLLPIAISPMVAGGLALLPIAFRAAHSARMNVVDWVMVVYLTAVTLSFWDNYSYPDQLTEVLFFTIAIPYFVARRLMQDDQVLRLATLVLVATAGALAAVGIYHRRADTNPFVEWRTPGYLADVWAKDVTRFGEVRASASFGQPLIFATFLAAMLVIAFAVAFAATSIPRKLIAWAIVLLIVVGIVSTGSRGPLLMMVIGVALFLFGTRERRAVRVATILAVMALLYGFTPLGDQVNKLLDSLRVGDEAANVDYRAELLSTLADPARYSLSGLGSGDYYAVGSQIGVISIDSQFVLILVQSGIIALVAFLALLVPLLRVALRHPNPLRRAWACAIVASYQGLITVALLLQQADVFWFGVAVAGASLPTMRSRDEALASSGAESGATKAMVPAGSGP